MLMFAPNCFYAAVENTPIVVWQLPHSFPVSFLIRSSPRPVIQLLISVVGYLAAGHSCSHVAIAFNTILVFVFGKVVTPTDAAFCLHRAYRSTVTPPRNDSPLRVCVLTRTSAVYLYRPHEDGSSKETLCSLHDHSWNINIQGRSV